MLLSRHLMTEVPMHRIALAALIATLGGCADVNYATEEPGTFKGEVAVVWLRGTEGSGDGTFVYVPTEGNPLRFTRPKGETMGREIVPGMMYTDGGSIPSFARMVNGLTPWNYGPAYIVHDWLFRAKQCLNDNKPKPEYDAVAELDFQESAEIIAEAIMALEKSGRVKKSRISGTLVTAAVSSPITYRYWTAKGDCSEVSDKDRETAEAAVGRKAVVGREKTLRFLNREKGTLETRTGQVVAVVSAEDM
jgi:tRNA threonylcarbamoyladenosine modification (KEOPS) complex  Pcc1 subunit